MTRHRLLLIGLPGAFVVLGVGAWVLWPRTAITRENAAKIVKGMTLGEVEALLGGPERIETTAPTEGDADDGPDAERLATARFRIALTHTVRSRRARIGSSHRTWGSDTVAIFVVFNADQHVID